MQRTQQSFKFRLRIDTPRQHRALARHAGGARFAYNWGLDQVKAALEARTTNPDARIPGHFDLTKAWTAHKNAHRLTWTDDVSTGTFQAALRNTHTAWQNFINSRTGQRPGRRVGFPRYKSRRLGHQSFQLHGATLGVHGPRALKLPKLGVLHTYEATRKLRRALNRTGPCSSCQQTGNCQPCNATGTVACPGDHTGERACRRCNDTGNVKCRDCRIKRGNNTGTGTGTCGTCGGTGTTTAARLVRCIVSRTPAGHWYAAFTVDIDREIRTKPIRTQHEGGRIGIDISPVGLTLSTGQVLAPPRTAAHTARRYAIAQRAAARRRRRDTNGRIIDSNRARAARLRAAKLAARTASIRRDWIDQAATALIHGVRPGTQHTELRGIGGHTDIIIEGYNLTELAMTTSKDPDVPAWVRRRRNRTQHDVALGEFRTRLTMRAHWYGTNVHLTEQHEPTGRTCHRCGTVRTKPIRPWETEFTCPATGCGWKGDKRLNTALSLAARRKDSSVRPEQRGDLKVGRGEPVSPPGSARKRASQRHGPTKRQAAYPPGVEPQSRERGSPPTRDTGGTSRGQPRDVPPTLW